MLLNNGSKWVRERKQKQNRSLHLHVGITKRNKPQQKNREQRPQNNAESRSKKRSPSAPPTTDVHGQKSTILWNDNLNHDHRNYRCKVRMTWPQLTVGPAAFQDIIGRVKTYFLMKPLLRLTSQKKMVHCSIPSTMIAILCFRVGSGQDTTSLPKSGVVKGALCLRLSFRFSLFPFFWVSLPLQFMIPI